MPHRVVFVGGVGVSECVGLVVHKAIVNVVYRQTANVT